MTLSPFSRVLFNTKRVCGKGPSEASTRSTAPSAIESARSTSPSKSECPGVSMILIFTPFHCTEQFLAAMVMPLSLSRSILSIILSLISRPCLNRPLCLNMASTRVVLPWSTCAMIAMFLIVSFFVVFFTLFTSISVTVIGQRFPVYGFPAEMQLLKKARAQVQLTGELQHKSVSEGI